MRTVIIDDEKQIREGLKILLAQIEEIHIIGEASTVSEAKTLIETQNPDLVLLDIQLQQQTGFELLNSLTSLNFKLIFVTAYNEHAIKAFKYNAFDYLLKPVDPKELYETIARLKQQNNSNKAQLKALNDNEAFEKLIIKTTEQMYVLPVKDIVRCEADQGYTHFYMVDGTHILSSKTLKEYDTMLPEAQFVRVHQSHLINWDYVSGYDKKGILILNNKQQIPVAVRKRSLVANLFK